ncbi:thiaminase II [Carnimonas nigrificans]|uniref:thiaminase II n=1 Tax=Carnimonas nigrificans TaxID=64323 RepID=UPI0004B68D96|nr:thiaminase II [Carnimonas nigrificans]
MREDAGSDWHAYVDHVFIQQLAQGTLPTAAFKHYLAQDYLFLTHFARAYALLVSKLRSVRHMRSATASLNAIFDELPLHIHYCAQWGIDEHQLQTAAECPETIAYTRYVLDIGHSGDALDLLSALLPCVAGYAEIGLALLHHPDIQLEHHPYAAWIRNYGEEEYLDGVKSALGLMEEVWQERGTEARFKAVSTIFTTATQLETRFWQMGLNAANGLST